MSRFFKTSFVAALVGIASLVPAHAQGQKVRIADANPFMLLQSLHHYVPLAMGWWSKDGYTVEVVHNPSSAGAMQALVGGAAELAVANSSPALSVVARGAGDLRIAHNFISTSWRIITPKSNTAINSIADLKGKKIGVIAAGGGSTAYLESALRQNNINPQSDVTIVAIGIGPQAFQAVQSGMVDAYIDYRSDIIQLENMGGDYKIFFDEAWLSFPDYGLVATQAFASASPNALIAVAKGMAKSAVFAEESPECVAKIHRKNHGTGSTTRPIETDIKFIKGWLDDVLVARKNNGTGRFGHVNEKNLDKLIVFLADNKVISAPFDAKKVLLDIPDFSVKVNDFSVEEVKAQARACTGF